MRTWRLKFQPALTLQVQLNRACRAVSAAQVTQQQAVPWSTVILKKAS